MRWTTMNHQELPMGLGMALSQNPAAMQSFSSLSTEQQQEIINHTHEIQSRREMHQYVQSLAEHKPSF